MYKLYTLVNCWLCYKIIMNKDNLIIKKPERLQLKPRNHTNSHVSESFWVFVDAYSSSADAMLPSMCPNYCPDLWEYQKDSSTRIFKVIYLWILKALRELYGPRSSITCQGTLFLTGGKPMQRTMMGFWFYSDFPMNLPASSTPLE